MVYFLIGSQITHGNAERTFAEVKNASLSGTLGNAGTGQIINLEKDKFRMGNLDSLMYLNEALMKMEVQLENTLKKIERQYDEVMTVKNFQGFKIEITVDEYIKKFKWNDSRFPRNNPLHELVKIIATRIHSIETDLRVKTQTYQETKNASNSINKKEGSIMTRDLADILTPNIVSDRDFIYTDFLTTVVCLVPDSTKEDFLAKYETFSDYVIPNSAKKFNYEDKKESVSIFRVVLVKDNILDAQEDINPEDKKKTPQQEFSELCREKCKAIVREFTFKPLEYEDRKKKRYELQQSADKTSVELKETCEKVFSDLYISYMHLKVLRFVVDSVMRFGQTHPLMTAVIKPNQGKEKKILQSLLKMFSDPADVGLYGTKEELDDSEDFFPFIYVPINIE